MEFINLSKKHSLTGSILHAVFNVALAAAVWVSIYVTKFPYAAIVLILLSKWRTLAVRPRYWVVNLKSNLVDIIFSLSIALLIWANGATNAISSGIFISLYIAWLALIKPRSEDIFIKTQALLAVFVGSMALFSISYEWPVLLVVVGGFLIGYSTFRHIISAETEQNIEIFSLFWAILVAEIFWMFNFWVQGYLVFGAVIIPQISIISTALSFGAFEFVLNAKDYQKRKKDLLIPTIVMFVLSFLLVLVFSGKGSGF